MASSTPNQAPSQAKSITLWQLGLALISTAIIAALIGVGFGSAVRFRLLDTPSAQLFNPQQDFPPLPNWPTKAATASFDTPYFPGVDSATTAIDDDFYRRPSDQETFIEDAEPLPDEDYLLEADPYEFESADSDFEYPLEDSPFEDRGADSVQPDTDNSDYRPEDFFPAAADPDKVHKPNLSQSFSGTKQLSKTLADGA